VFFVMMLFLLLFTGFCIVILAVAVEDVSGKKGSEKSAGDTTTRTREHKSESRL
jgi:hypothetical protein